MKGHADLAPSPCAGPSSAGGWRTCVPGPRNVIDTAAVRNAKLALFDEPGPSRESAAGGEAIGMGPMKKRGT
jgi:hypothetical protein